MTANAPIAPILPHGANFFHPIRRLLTKSLPGLFIPADSRSCSCTEFHTETDGQKACPAHFGVLK
jgi:hypothetical protein